MNKHEASRLINRLGGGSELLYCTRVYVNARLYPTGWKEMEYFLNITFYLIRGERQHIRSSYLWEVRKVSKEKKCEQCGDMHDPNAEEAVNTDKYNGKKWVKYNYCCEGCANIHHLTNLRNAGM